MELDDTSKPKSVNKEHFSLEKFPNIIAFCDRDDTSHVVNGAEENYSYKLHDKTVYTVKKKDTRWEIIELENAKAVKVSTGDNLGTVLAHALTFGPGDIHMQSTKINVLIPVSAIDQAKAVSIMYYLGGYPVSSEPKKSELATIMERFLYPELVFLIYSHVPFEYLPYLSEELKKAGLIGQDNSRRIWAFKM